MTTEPTRIHAPPASKTAASGAGSGRNGNGADLINGTMGGGLEMRGFSCAFVVLLSVLYYTKHLINTETTK